MNFKPALPPLLASLAFLAVFNLFYTIAPYPISIVSIDDVYKFAPSGYTKLDDGPEKIVSKLSTWRGYEVIEYWYYWPYDGYEKKDDWEPVVLVIKDNVKAVAVRIHYSWRVSFVFPQDGLKPVVTFNHLWHTPFLKEPPPDWEEVKIKPVIGIPPEKLDYDSIFGFGFLPTQSAIVSAMIFGCVAFIAVYYLSEVFVVRKRA